MTRVVMEHVEYELNVPETGVQPDSLTFVEIDQEKCIGCDTCQQYCPTGAIYGETFEPHTIKYRELCINCGQCLTHCPSMAIYEVRSWVPKLEEKLKDSHVKCVAMPAPSVRYALGEAFGLPVGRLHEPVAIHDMARRHHEHGLARCGSAQAESGIRTAGLFPLGNDLFLLSRLSSDLQAGRRMDLALRHLPHDQPAGLVERL